jgi:hypothetical protein
MRRRLNDRLFIVIAPQQYPDTTDRSTLELSGRPLPSMNFLPKSVVFLRIQNLYSESRTVLRGDDRGRAPFGFA